MSTRLYFRNLRQWAVGWRHLDELLYKSGWGPWSFAPLYATTYLAGTLAGYGVVSLSRAWADRSRFIVVAGWGDPLQYKHPFARFMTRLLNWIFPGSQHGILAGPRLWGSVNLRDKP